jgi:signal transduction histidine kinase
MFVSLALTGGCLAWFVARLNAELWERKQLEREMDQISQIELHDVGDGLHEDLCQRLAGLAALGKLLESQLRSARTSESEVAGEITRELKQTLVLANQLADRLQPIAPLENGFLAAVNKLAAMTQAKFGTCCQVIDCGFPALLDRRLANNLFRVVQEALNNALSHPGATLIQIKLSSCDGSLRVEVTDDGIGMSDSGSSTGARLQVMRYCCELIEASLSLGRLMPHGTAVVVQLPER